MTAKITIADPDYAPPVPAIAAGRRPFRYSLERYHAAVAAGIITENDQVELIFGEIVEKMGIGKRHGDCLDKITLYFVMRFGMDYVCRPQNPITLDAMVSEPEPDFAIVNKTTYATREGNPEAADIHLLVEISDSSLEYDRTAKTVLYAHSGIPEYWIINLQQDQLELHLDPDIERGEYASIQRYKTGMSFTSPFCGELAVEALLP